MAIKSWPYVSIEGDRKITAGDVAQGFDLISTSGVVPGFLNELMPSKVTGSLNVQVDTGAALVGGRWYTQDAPEQVALDAGDSLPRIDVVAVESNSNTPVRAGRLVVIKGTPAASPVAPELTNTGAVSQIELCRVLVPASATTLDSATLTDTRTFVIGRHMHILSFALGGDGTIYWDSTNKVAILQITGCQPVQLAPVVLGTSANPPAGTYPKGTLYIQYI